MCTSESSANSSAQNWACPYPLEDSLRHSFHCYPEIGIGGLIYYTLPSPHHKATHLGFHIPILPEMLVIMVREYIGSPIDGCNHAQTGAASGR